MRDTPVAAVALLLGADRLMYSMRVFTNLLGNCMATFVAARWEGLLDKERMRAALDGELDSSTDLNDVPEVLDARTERRVAAPHSVGAAGEHADPDEQPGHGHRSDPTAVVSGAERHNA